MACRSVQRRPSWWQTTPMASVLTLPPTKGNWRPSVALNIGELLYDEGSKHEVLSRIAQTTAAVTKLKLIWNDKSIAISYEIRLVRSLAMSIFLYASETWTITSDIERRIQTLEMRCIRKLLHISYRDHKNNEEVKARIGNAIGPYEDLITSVKRRKLKWNGHVTRSSGLAKTILQGTVQGLRRRGRQTKRREDKTKEWTGLEWNILLRKAENNQEWRKLVVKSTVVPQCQSDYGIGKIRDKVFSFFVNLFSSAVFPLTLQFPPLLRQLLASCHTQCKWPDTVVQKWFFVFQV